MHPSLKQMTLAETRELRDAMGKLCDAGGVLERAGMEVTVSLTDRDTTLRVPSLWGTPGPVDTVVEIDDVPATATYPAAPVPQAEAANDEDAAPPASAAPSTVSAAPPASAAPSTVSAAPSPLPFGERQIGKDGLLRGPWLKEEEDTIRRMHAAGDSWPAIAEALGRPVPAVSYRGRSLGLTKPKAPAPKAIRTGGRSGSDVAPALSPGKTPADECIGSPQGVSAEAAPGDTQSKTSGVAEAPKSAPANAGPRERAPVRDVPSARTGEKAAPAAVVTPSPSIPPQGAARNKGTACPDDLRGLQREVWFHLGSLAADPIFGTDLDLDLVEGLASGQKLGELALDLGVDAAKAKARFELLTEVIRDQKNRITTDGQPALLAVLRRRAQIERGVPA
ncbi:hypothetical protein C4N9_20580 [Pararhodobacter marinus]|uniref:Uncharacterized protein n=1 Tax=Pararhodobacter marinus TaxID=2184063 RepID=A0A2U2C471_9RHOB|nr:hypothetical protein [Pararhodobacter marinus]PWE26663.1 hypothetical protein C4N9_20580 [Pararhodobacter marinus]